MTDDPVIALATTFGPILKAAFPSEHSVTRFQVANALAEASLALSLQDDVVETLECILKCTAMARDGEVIFDCGDPYELARSLLTRIRKG